jgi:hypothetical protein
MVKLNCVRCGKEYSVKPYRKTTAKYCSDFCRLQSDIFRKGNHNSPNTEFKTGRIYTQSDAHKKHISEANLGKHHSEETKQKIRIANLGRHPSEETKRKIGLIHKGNKYQLGRKQSKETIEKRVSKFRGENHFNWQGGKSFKPYGLEFNKKLKELIRDREGRRCFICKITELKNKEKLTIHHIDYNKKNNNPNNLIALCRSCHAITNFNRTHWAGYFNH